MAVVLVRIGMTNVRARREAAAYGPEAVMITCAPDELLGLINALRVAMPAAVAHSAESSVLVQVPAGVDQAEVIELAQSIDAREVIAEDEHAQPLTLAVRYDGLDLAFVADHLGMSTAEVVRLHCQPTYTSMFCGFVPGFSYLGGLDPALQIPRRATPRTQVPRGSVAIAAHYTAVYPRATAGGWHILGTCAVELFDTSLNPPVLLPPGRRLRFEPLP